MQKQSLLPRTQIRTSCLWLLGRHWTVCPLVIADTSGWDSGIHGKNPAPVESTSRQFYAILLHCPSPSLLLRPWVPSKGRELHKCVAPWKQEARDVLIGYNLIGSSQRISWWDGVNLLSNLFLCRPYHLILCNLILCIAYALTMNRHPDGRPAIWATQDDYVRLHKFFVYACTGTPESRMFKLRKLENRKWSTGTTSIATSVASNRLPDWVHGFVLKWTGPIQFLQHIPTLSFGSLWESESGNHADCNAKTPPADNSWLSYLKALWLREGYKDQMSPAKRELATDKARTLHLTSFNII